MHFLPAGADNLPGAVDLPGPLDSGEVLSGTPEDVVQNGFNDPSVVQNGGDQHVGDPSVFPNLPLDDKSPSRHEFSQGTYTFTPDPEKRDVYHVKIQATNSGHLSSRNRRNSPRSASPVMRNQVFNRRRGTLSSSSSRLDSSGHQGSNRLTNRQRFLQLLKDRLSFSSLGGKSKTNNGKSNNFSFNHTLEEATGVKPTTFQKLLGVCGVSQMAGLASKYFLGWEKPLAVVNSINSAVAFGSMCLVYSGCMTKITQETLRDVAKYDIQGFLRCGDDSCGLSDGGSANESGSSARGGSGCANFESDSSAQCVSAGGVNDEKKNN